MSKKCRTKLGINSIIESWVDSHQDSETFFESWVDLNQNSGSLLSRASIWIKFQKSILSRELIWINSCKTIVIHQFSRIRTSWDRVESNKKWVIPYYPCLVSVAHCRGVPGEVEHQMSRFIPPPPPQAGTSYRDIGEPWMSFCSLIKSLSEYSVWKR